MNRLFNLGECSFYVEKYNTNCNNLCLRQTLHLCNVWAKTQPPITRRRLRPRFRNLWGRRRSIQSKMERTHPYNRRWPYQSKSTQPLDKKRPHRRRKTRRQRLASFLLVGYFLDQDPHQTPQIRGSNWDIEICEEGTWGWRKLAL